ncbi:mechanosensitive ion channel family protein [Sphingomonas sp. ac-8]|uniref:mechanosensitive ion channel family protein n=1 Tax=Sphingomonas sp. ac-8 TaxID=3242977 RepID=UPI003A7FC9AB
MIRLADYGIVVPGWPDLLEAGIAAALVLVALLLGWLAGRRLGPAVATFWGTRVGSAVEGLGPRMCQIVRHGSAAALLAIVAGGYAWHPLSAFGIGFALGAATAKLTIDVLRGLHLPRWAAWGIGAVVFVALLSNALGGFDNVTTALERIGFDVGRRRLSLLSVVSVAVVAIGLYALVRLANRLVGHSIGQAKTLDATQKLLAQKLAAIGAVVIAFFFGIDLLGIDLTTFAVFSGGLGLAIGFGLQKTVGNLIAGIILLMDRSIKPGDVIVVGESFGWVNKIGVRAVSVITRDGKEHLIPNENLMTQEVENWSFTDRNVRVRIPVKVGYESDLKLAQSLMLRAASESPRVLKSPKPNVWLTSYGDYAAEHDILVWISDPESGVGNVRSDVLNRLWLLFKEHGIVIPVPRREMILREPAAAAGIAAAPAAQADFPAAKDTD